MLGMTALGCHKPKQLWAVLACDWAARYNTWLLINLAPKGIVISFLLLVTLSVPSNLNKDTCED